MHSRQRGFTLIEVLVAFAIAATSLSLLFRIHSNSSGTLVMAEEYLVATELAKSLLDEMSVTESALAFERSGSYEDKYRWSIRGEEYVPATASLSSQEGTPPPFLLRELSVRVSWQSRSRTERFELRTVRPLISDETDASSSL